MADKEIMKDHSFTEYDMDANSNDDWTQNSNNVTILSLSNNLQKCLLCSKLFDSMSLIKHNLIHLRVKLEILPDKIFQFYEQDTTKFKNNKKPDISEINQHSNTVISDGKPESEEIQSENSNDLFFDEDNSSMEFTMERNTNNIVSKIKFDVDPETTRFETYEDPDISEKQSDNSSDLFSDVKAPNKDTEDNSCMEFNMKKKLGKVACRET